MKISPDKKGFNMKRKSQALQESLFAYKMVGPMFSVFLLMGLFPILYSFYVSFLNWRLNIAAKPKVIGFGNYVKAFSDQIFLQSLPKTGFFVLLIVTGSTVFGLLFASLLNSKYIKRKEFFLLLSLLPWAVPRVVGGLMWKWIFDGNYGILNFLLKQFGLINSYKWWFMESTWKALAMAAIVEIWRNAPFAGLLCFTGFQNISVSLYEAAELDGANAAQRFFYVTLPGIKIVLMSVLILLTTWGLKTFDTIFIMTGGGPGTNTMITYMYIYQQAFNYLNMSYGSALGYIFTVIILLMILLYYKTFNRDNA